MSLVPSLYSAPMALFSLALALPANGANLGSLDSVTDNSSDDDSDDQDSNSSSDSNDDSNDNNDNNDGKATQTQAKTQKQTLQNTLNTNTNAQTQLGTTTTGTATDTATTDTANTDTANTDTGTTDKTANTALTHDTSATGVTYNQWGFTGSQSKWEATTLTDSASDSASESTSNSQTTHSISKNKTNSAHTLNNVFQLQERPQWRSVIMVGGILLFSTALGCL